MQTSGLVKTPSELTKKACPVCMIVLRDEQWGRRYCSETCRKTAEIRRYRFKNRHGVLIEDVLPTDGKWLSKLDVAIEEALRAHRPSHNEEPNRSWIQKRRGRRQLARVVRQDGTVNYMALREQAFNTVVRGRALIKGYRSGARTRTNVSEAKEKANPQRRVYVRPLSEAAYLTVLNQYLQVNREASKR